MASQRSRGLGKVWVDEGVGVSPGGHSGCPRGPVARLETGTELGVGSRSRGLPAARLPTDAGAVPVRTTGQLGKLTPGRGSCTCAVPLPGDPGTARLGLAPAPRRTARYLPPPRALIRGTAPGRAQSLRRCSLALPSLLSTHPPRGGQLTSGPVTEVPASRDCIPGVPPACCLGQTYTEPLVDLRSHLAGFPDSDLLSPATGSGPRRSEVGRPGPGVLPRTARCSGGHSPPGGSGREASWARALGDGGAGARQSWLFSRICFAAGSSALLSMRSGCGDAPPVRSDPVTRLRGWGGPPRSRQNWERWGPRAPRAPSCPVSVFYLTSLPSGFQLSSPGTRGRRHSLWASLQRCPSGAPSLRTQLCSPHPCLDAGYPALSWAPAEKPIVFRSPGHAAALGAEVQLPFLQPHPPCDLK